MSVRSPLQLPSGIRIDSRHSNLPGNSVNSWHPEGIWPEDSCEYQVQAFMLNGPLFAFNFDFFLNHILMAYNLNIMEMLCKLRAYCPFQGITTRKEACAGWAQYKISQILLKSSCLSLQMQDALTQIRKPRSSASSPHTDESHALPIHYHQTESCENKVNTHSSLITSPPDTKAHHTHSKTDMAYFILYRE